MADDASGNDGDGGDDDGRRDAPANRSIDPDREDRFESVARSDRDSLERSAHDERGQRRRDEEYRIPLDLSGSADDAATDGTDDEDDPYAPEPSSTPVTPGDPNVENVVFVLLGAVAMVLVLARLLLIL